MEKHYPAITITIVMLIAFSFNIQSAIDNTHRTEMPNDTIFPRGNIISNNNFSGSAWLSWLVQGDSIYNCPIGNVTFEPGARTNWHMHPGGQILLVTEGTGFYQEKSKPAQLIKKGDVVRIGPDVEHWHGATADSELTHIAINTNVQKGSVVWLQPVTDEEYSRPTVQTLSGIVRGINEEKTDIFKGIPYAAPPVGEFRWRPPQPVQPWQGVRDACEFGANCAQAGWPRGSGTIAEGSSEDCLFLNIWRPAGAKQGAKLPVMVWIHGGAFVGGSGSGLSGSQFARQGVILVSINYRLGRLGHFAFPALSKEHPEEPKGSYAFMDQIAALRWVQQNIAAFGGDPENVTIFGFSAGGVSIHSLLTIPAAQGLFHKAISHSGGGRDGVLTGRPISKENADKYYPVSAETIGINFARKHGIEGTDAAALARLSDHT